MSSEAFDGVATTFTDVSGEPTAGRSARGVIFGAGEGPLTSASAADTDVLGVGCASVDVEVAVLLPKGTGVRAGGTESGVVTVAGFRMEAPEPAEEVSSQKSTARCVNSRCT